MPVWISDYVLAGYGTGAIMAVPAHDARDFEFALAFGLPVRPVVQPPTAWLDARADGTDYADGTELWAATRTDAREWGEAYTGDGPIVNSDASGRPVSDIADGGVKLDDLGVEAAASAMLTWLDDNGVGRARTTYKLRDWLFSRQRYWGEPIPVVHVDGAPKPLPPDALPISLPEVESYQPAPTGESPLATQQDWLETTDPETGAPALRETNTMPQWAGSCWYYLRFIDPDNTEAPVDPEKEAYWMPVDLYVGGAEHAVLHLLYARFWHMVLFDAGVVQTPEPFRKLVNQGMILGEVEYTGFQRLGADGEPFGWVSAEHAVELDGEEAAGDATHQDARDGASLVAVRVEEGDVEKRGDAFVLRADGTVRVTSRAHKMSKSRGNVVNPDDIVAEYGADSLRLYEMFMGPLEQVKPWNTRSVDGVHRFLARAWRLLLDQAPGSESGAGSFGEVTGLAARVTGDAGARAAARAPRRHREGDRRRRGPALQHGHLGADGAAQRDVQVGDGPARRRRAVRAPARAVRAPPRRGAVGRARARRHARLRGVAGAGRTVPRRRRGRDRGAGQRQAPRDRRACAGRHEGGHAGGGARRVERDALPRRRHHPQGDRRARPARQLRRGVARPDTHRTFSRIQAHASHA